MKKNNLKSIVKNGEHFDAIFEKIDSDYICDIMFTGGSTGVHKGACLYGNGYNYVVTAFNKIFILEPGQVHLGNIPVNHMVFGKYLTHYCLANNLEYALTLKMKPENFTEEVIRTRAAGITGGPVHFENFIDNPKIKNGSLSSVIQAASGGEQFKAKKKQEAEEALRKGGSKAIISNAIGSTEVTSVYSVDFIDTRKYTDLNAYPFNVDYEKNHVTCGYPIPGMSYKIVEDKDTFKEVKKGEPGLIYVSGPSVMKEYYNNEEENKKVFRYEDGKKWFCLGDIMRNTGEDTHELEFVGRAKRNFVCNVTNIYPEEIESLLLQIPEIREVVVTPVPDNKYQFLPSYHISIYDEDCNTNTLKNKIDNLIQKTLGDDALPGYISYTTDPLPRTDNGKLNAVVLEKEDLENLERLQKIKV